MTREEARERLRGILTEAVEFENSVCYVTEEDREPLEMAIKALEQEKPETVTEFADRCRECGAKYGKLLKQKPSGDLISREETLTAFADYVGSGMGMDDYDALWNIVAKMPSVNPQPKTGHWIFDEILDKHYYCSECKSMGVDYWDYCPNCGAKMIEPQKSEE